MNLQPIKARCEAATPGPWFVVRGDDDHAMGAVGIATGERVSDDFFEYGRCADHEKTVAVTLWQAPRIATHQSNRWHEDAAFIASARTDVPALLAEVARLQDAIAAVKRAVVECVNGDVHVSACLVEECDCVDRVLKRALHDLDGAAGGST